MKKELFIEKYCTFSNIFLLVVTIFLMFSLMGLSYQKTRLQVAKQYIADLEAIIEQDGTVIGDVCGTDAYCDWYMND